VAKKTKLPDDREKLSFLLGSCITELFEALRIDINDYRINSTEIRGVCPCHKESDNLTAFNYYFHNNLWFCWTEQCHKKKGADLIGLIANLKQLNVGIACQWAKRFLLGKNITTADLAVKLRNMERRQQKEKQVDHWKKHLVQRSFDQDTVTRLHPVDKYFKRRGLDPKVGRAMEVGYAREGLMQKRIVFPVRNVLGKIVGFTGRAISDDYPIKWLHLPKKPSRYPESKRWFSASLNMLNIDTAVKHIRRTNAVILGEGPFETVKLRMAGFHNSVCVFGLRISEAQTEILRRCNTVHAILGFDPDKVDSAEVRDNIEKLQAKEFDVRVLRWEGDEDIGAMSVEKLQGVMEQVSDIRSFGKWRVHG